MTPTWRDLILLGSCWAMRALKARGWFPNLSIEKICDPSFDPRRGVKGFQTLAGPDILGAADGWLFTKTFNALLRRDLCWHPDEPDEELADGLNDPSKIAKLILLDETPEGIEHALRLCRSHNRMLAAPAGSGSWGETCRQELKVYIDASRKPSWVNLEKTEAATRAAYRPFGINMVDTDDHDAAHIHKEWTRGRGWIGLAEFNNQTCTDHVFNYRDVNYRGNDNTQIVLDEHEVGHNMNCQHTSGGIMNPYILDTTPHFVLWDENGKLIHRDVAVNQLTRFFGEPRMPEQPKPEPPKPEPPPQPPSAKVDIRPNRHGGWNIYLDGEFIRSENSVPLNRHWARRLAYAKTDEERLEAVKAIQKNSDWMSEFRQ